MEKSLVATNEKVSDHIYDDIALAILSKLPLKSLIRFSCVRKSWSLLFQNSYFMNMFRRNFLSKDLSYYNDTSILLQHIAPLSQRYKYDPKLYSLFGDKFENMIKLDWPNPYEDPFDFIIHGSVNGILCIQDVKSGGRMPESIRCIEELGRYVLWNPATEEFKIIPTSPFAFECPCWYPIIDFQGFGYDRIGDNYKVIRHVEFYPRYSEEYENETLKDGFLSPLWEIYCLKSNSWKKLDIDMPRQYYGSVGLHVYMDGVCHWWSESEIGNEVYLVSFDLRNEVFVKTFIPSNMDDADIDIGIDTRIVFRDVVVLNGAIGWISNYNKAAPTFHISILGEVGVKESWTKLFTVGPLSCVEYVIGVGKNGDIFFRKNDDELVWVNLNTQRIEELGVKGDHHRCKIMIYKESFLPFASINN
ncbi:F-box only protein 8-like [Vicia villosa]|uniref:F-box only protein 8-like n=1 Tax=Vicia villosa TaxID=3911 RepID=UPI00273C4A24|nr:F-box only protein 8-like [Vicia villosa]